MNPPEAVQPIGIDETFNRRVLAWLADQGATDVAEITSMASHGSDYAGSTEQGFHMTFEVNISWRNKDGSAGRWSVAGEDMASLWNWVVKAEGPEGRRP